MPSLNSFIASARSELSGRKPNAEIVERWNSRVIPRGLDKMGARGAQQYLTDYGRNISSKKVKLLAIQAENEQRPEMAAEFWKQAYIIEIGTEPTDEEHSQAMDVIETRISNKVYRSGSQSSLPENLQAGHIVPAQPMDSNIPLESLLMDSSYWAEPKVDGIKCLAIGEDGNVQYQRRSMNVVGAPSQEIHQGLVAAVEHFGAFVLEGEVTYLDFEGKEHRTGAQAATANVIGGWPELPVWPRYAIWTCLFADGRDLTKTGNYYRKQFSDQIGLWLERYYPDHFINVRAYRSYGEKKFLVDKQMQEGREGVVFKALYEYYYPGKDAHNRLWRVKFLTEHKIKVVDLPLSDKPGRPFKAIGVELDGNHVGYIGTGFTRAQADEISRRFQAGQAKGYDLYILIQSQGFTETGQLFMGRFVDFVEEGEPEAS